MIIIVMILFFVKRESDAEDLLLSQTSKADQAKSKACLLFPKSSQVLSFSLNNRDQRQEWQELRRCRIEYSGLRARPLAFKTTVRTCVSTTPSFLLQHAYPLVIPLFLAEYKMNEWMNGYNETCIWVAEIYLQEEHKNTSQESMKRMLEASSPPDIVIFKQDLQENKQDFTTKNGWKCCTLLYSCLESLLLYL